jgi:predicted RNA-binding protein with PUA-like domain
LTNVTPKSPTTKSRWQQVKLTSKLFILNQINLVRVNSEPEIETFALLDISSNCTVCNEKKCGVECEEDLPVYN